eukprot:TRINITY_DN11891_c0_g1_i1.p1 TRINITY_DN11891_c0_g1~~TRINITY_DN11891_c0_g1_i1.p1  ORF type:complete len:540 (+),score=125.67 TRINITY_DN11891_c0_g1_i1:140-1621(+)
MLNSAFLKKEGNSLLTQQMIVEIITNVLGVDKPQHFEESLCIEQLQLATLLVRYMPNELIEHRKELIKFAWNHLKSEDSTSKQCAYVLVCRFIEAYDTPPKIILQVYVTLLRAYPPETRTLVKQALDILTPALKRRLPAGDPKYPMWIKCTKKVIVEEGHSLPQLLHILQLIVRHPQLFYPCRGQFIPQMVSSLARIGLVPNSPSDNRKLSVDLVDLIISWEKQRIADHNKSEKPAIKEETMTDVEDPKSKKAQEAKETKKAKVSKEETPAPAGSTTAQPDDEFKLSANIIEMIVNFLVRVACTTNDQRDFQGLAVRAQDLLKEALTMWPHTTIKFAYFEKLLALVVDQPNVVCNSLSVLGVILDYQLPFFLQSYGPALSQSLVPSFNSDNPKIIAGVCVILKKIMKSQPISKPPPELIPFYQKLSEVIENGLTSFEQTPPPNGLSILTILKTLSEEQQEYIDQYLGHLIKIFQKLTKDHLTPSKDNDARTLR